MAESSDAAIRPNSLWYHGPPLTSVDPDVTWSGYVSQRIDGGGLQAGATAVLTFAAGDYWMDLTSAMINIEVSIQKAHADMNPNQDKEKVFIPPKGHLMFFDKATTTLGGNIVAVEPDFGLSSVLMDLLSATSYQQTNMLEPLSSTSLDTKPQSSVVEKSLAPNFYQPLVNKAKGSKSQSIWLRIGSSFWRSCRQLIPSGTEVKLALTRGTDAAVLAIGKLDNNDHFNLHVHSLSLVVRAHRFSPTGAAKVQATLGQSPELRYRRLDVIQRSIPTNTVTMNFSNLNHNLPHPDRLVISLVRQEAAYGDMEMLPGFLETANLTSVSLTVAGRSVHAVPIDNLDFDYDNNGRIDLNASSYQSAYAQLCLAGGYMDPATPCPITYENFARGCCIFLFRLPGSFNGAQSTEPIDLRLTFKEATKDPFTLVVWTQRDAATRFAPDRSTYEPMA